MVTLHPKSLLSVVTKMAMESGTIEVPRDIVEHFARCLLRYRLWCSDHMSPITNDDLNAIYMAATTREALVSTKH